MPVLSSSDVEDEWEEVQQCTQTAADTPDATTSQFESESAQQGNDESSPSTSTITVELKKRQKRRGITKADRLLQADLHHAHLAALLVNCQRRNRMCDNPLIQSLVLSHLPSSLLDRFEDGGRGSEAVKEEMSHIMIDADDAHSTDFEYPDKGKGHVEDNDDDTDEEDVVILPSKRHRSSLPPRRSKPTKKPKTVKSKRKSKPVAVSDHGSSKKEMLVELSEWFSETFAVVPLWNGTRELSLLESAQYMRGSSVNMYLLFISLCRALKFDCRLVVALKPVNFYVTMKQLDSGKVKQGDTNPIKLDIVDEDDGEYTESGVYIRPPLNTKKSGKTNSKDDVNTIIPESKVWAEFFVADEKRWMAFDCLSPEPFQSIGTELDISQEPFSYIVGLEPSSNRIKDITPKYLVDVTSPKFRKNRSPQWFADVLASSFAGPIMDQEAEAADNELIQSRLLSTAMPTSISAFHNHPAYVLERHLKKFEIIHPREEEQSLGEIRGELIFPRSCVKLLHTADKWLSMEGRIVRKGEKPLKSVKSRSASSSARDKKRIKRLSNEDEDDENVAPASNGEISGDGNVGLFGEWQTEVFVPSPIVNGIIPKNRYDNMDLFKPEMLPPGAAHLTEENIFQDSETDINEMRSQMRLPTLKKIAKSLEIDFAEAVTGFEYHGGFPVPRLEGIVVAVENENLVRQEYIEQVMKCITKVRLEQEKRVAQRWERLVRKALNFLRLKEKFKH